MFTWGDNFKLSKEYYNPEHFIDKDILSLPSSLSEAYPQRWSQPINTCLRIRIGKLAFLYLFLLNFPGFTVVKNPPANGWVAGSGNGILL